MSTVVDSGLFLALLHQGDPGYEAAVAFFQEARRGKHGTLLCPDAVYVEVMNYLRRRPTRRNACDKMRNLRASNELPVRWLPVGADMMSKADEAYFRHFDAELSMTDAIVLVTARDAGAKVATFDSGFRGLVPVVP